MATNKINFEMPIMTTHPSREQLSAYTLGQLPPAEATSIENHISECEPCCDTIISLSSDDTFVALLKDARQLPIAPSVDHDCQVSRSSSTHGDIPPELTEHPRYEIVRLIGKGGMGDVYEAIHRKMERKVALKVINRELFQKPEAVSRFHREVKAAAQLSHPNIVTSYDADQAGDFHFMVMEYVDGVDLSQIVKDRGALPIADAVDYIRQAAIGLQHAHEQGMVHRDIKPHNLMVSKNGVIKILDFGLASLASETGTSSDSAVLRSDLTIAGAIMGTPDFISPEQAIDARQVDIRSDIYSLGATLYYLLSGRVPFDDGNVMHKLKSHAQIEPVRLDAMRNDIPDEVVSIASKMMAKNADERYLTPKQVAEALESFLRTWRPDEENPRDHEPSNGGNMFRSGGKESQVSDSSWNWWLVIARVLVSIACIPVAVIFYEAWTINFESSLLEREGYQIPTYLLTVLSFALIAGFMLVLHKRNTKNRRSDGGDQHAVSMKSKDLITIAAVVLAGFVATFFYYSQLNKWRFIGGEGHVVWFTQQMLDTKPGIDLDPSERAVELFVSGEDASLVKQGDQVRLQFAGWPLVPDRPYAGLFQGRVIQISTNSPSNIQLLVKENKTTEDDGWPDARYLLSGAGAKGWILLAD